MPVNDPLPDACLNQTFRNARTRNSWLDRGVPETLIRATYDLMRLGPTAANQCPARFLWLRSDEAKARLIPHMTEKNRAKTMAAPWVAIIAWDYDFPENIPRLLPQNPGARDWYASDTARTQNGFRNGTLQAGYFIVAARMMGLDCGPMSGFSVSGVEQEFFAGDPKMESWRVNFICNIGYGGDEGLYPRNPRLDFEDACEIR